MIPAAALAVIEAAHEDARRAHGGTRYAARLALAALHRDGWAVHATSAVSLRTTFHAWYVPSVQATLHERNALPDNPRKERTRHGRRDRHNDHRESHR